MGWLRKLLDGDHEAAAELATPIPSGADLVPPSLPHLDRHDPAPLDDRPYATTVCPYCDAPQEPLPRRTTKCKACGEPIVVKGGEDGKRHLLREDDMNEFEQQQEQIRTERYEHDETVLESDFFADDHSAVPDDLLRALQKALRLDGESPTLLGDEVAAPAQESLRWIGNREDVAEPGIEGVHRPVSGLEHRSDGGLSGRRIVHRHQARPHRISEILAVPRGFC